MIEEALYAALRAGLPESVRIYPSQVPEGIAPPFVAFRETSTRSERKYSLTTETVTFEIDSANAKGLEAERYRDTKILANQIRTALRDGFQDDEVCVYDVDIGTRQDLIDHVDSMHWTRSTFTFTYDATY